MTFPGPLFEPRRCRCGAVLKPRQRSCCSRRCALRAGFTPASIKARENLAALLARVPQHIVDASVQKTGEYMQVADSAARALRRRSGALICTTWADELRKAAGT